MIKDKKLEEHLLLIHAVARHLNEWEKEWVVLETEDWKEKARKECERDRARLKVLLLELGRME